MEYSHVPVMLDEVIESIKPKPGGIYIDCTLGGAGYTVELARRIGKNGLLISIDLDKNAILNAKKILKKIAIDNVRLVKNNFKNLKEIIDRELGENKKVDGVVMDLGLSSFQLDDEKRGFSFKGVRPLNMSFNADLETETINIINNYSLLELTRIFREYGEEKKAYQIAKAIVDVRQNNKIVDTLSLVKIIESKIPFKFRTKIHPATRIFQALRMETNKELMNLESVLPQIEDVLKERGRLAIVSFHSGEDRIVKRFLKNSSKLIPLNKKPIIPSFQEIAENPRSRSAKLRAAIKWQEIE